MERPESNQRSGRARGRVTAVLSVTALGIATAVAALVPGPASGASTGSTGSTGNTGSAAVVTPLLKFFEFGNAVGLPLLCSDSGSIVSIFGAQTETSSATSPLVTELDSQCSQLSSQGGGYLQQAIAESRSLTLVNPVVDPLIADLSTGLSTGGTEFGASLAPFGPTVAGLGGTVAFFEGS
jgi:hypothetical protein